LDFYLYVSDPVFLNQLISRFQLKNPNEIWSRKLNAFGVFTHVRSGDAMVLEVQDLLNENPFLPTIKHLLPENATLKFHFIVDEFQYDKDGDYAGILPMLQKCSSVLQELSGDAVLLSANHDVVLRRENRRLTLNSNTDFWNPYRVSQLPLPNHLEPLAH
jgi:hypothetical protein